MLTHIHGEMSDDDYLMQEDDIIDEGDDNNFLDIKKMVWSEGWYLLQMS